MKILLVGAAGQGKLAYARQQFQMESGYVAQGETMSLSEPMEQNILYGLHILVRRLMDDGKNPEQEIETLLPQFGDWIVICDEVGSGVVPADPVERDWRERVGCLCCELARQADVVERITCGIPQRLKGTQL